MLIAIGVAVVLLSAGVLSLSAMLLTESVPMVLSKKDPQPPAISWIRGTGTFFDKHWVGFNMLAGLTSTISGLLVLFFTPYGQALVDGRSNDPDLSMGFLCLFAACMLGFHLVWSSGLDWRYHRLPRWTMVAHMLAMTIIEILCLALSANYSWLILSAVIIAIMCWLMGIPVGSGMSDGRLYVIMASACVPFMLTKIWLPVVVIGVAVIINVIVSMLTGGMMLRAEQDTDENIVMRILKAKSPMGPFCAIIFYVFFMLYTTGILPMTAILG